MVSPNRQSHIAANPNRVRQAQEYNATPFSATRSPSPNNESTPKADSAAKEMLNERRVERRMLNLVNIPEGTSRSVNLKEVTLFRRVNFRARGRTLQWL